MSLKNIQLELKPASPIIIQHLPSLSECSQLVKKLKPLTRIAPTNVLNRDTCLPKGPFNIPFLRAMSAGVVPDSLRLDVLSSLINGFSTRYRGGCYFQRNFSTKLKGDNMKMAMERMKTEVASGFCLGPFDQCPFPSSWCDAQAYISQLFFIPNINLFLIVVSG